ncbi:MAG: hypothetical protein EBZ77_00430 [Chitinophagia bacterium]|nr:hypothetical protein [Chitinophagia bacterium]
MFSKFWKFGKGEKENKEQLNLPEGLNWSFLGADMHSHFIPGIDDGAKDIDDSITLIRAMREMGFTHLVTTPHTFIDYYPNTTETITQGLALVRQRLAEEQIDIQLSAASEYYIDETFLELIDKQPLLTITKNEVLVEFSMVYEPPMLNQAIFKLISAGYKPIIAHPERYNFFHNDTERYSELKDRGCRLQLNLLSLTGYYGRNVMLAAQKLLDSKMFDYAGSDAHHTRHCTNLQLMLTTKTMVQLLDYPFLNSKLCF